MPPWGNEHVLEKRRELVLPSEQPPSVYQSFPNDRQMLSSKCHTEAHSSPTAVKSEPRRKPRSAKSQHPTAVNDHVCDDRFHDFSLIQMPARSHSWDSSLQHSLGVSCALSILWLSGFQGRSQSLASNRCGDRCANTFHPIHENLLNIMRQRRGRRA